MRAYTVAATAVTLGVTRKWVDNVLSHYRVPGVLQEKQGVVRRVTPTGLLTLEITLSLSRGLGIAIPEALRIANTLIEVRGREIALAQAPAIRVSADIGTLVGALNTRLERALEITPIPKRGRPRHK